MRFILLFIIWFSILLPLNYGIKWGFILRHKSFWIGLHYSDYNNRYCLNIIPGIIIWWIGKYGKVPNKIM
jgi:hypothetical protein